jgi:ATPase subunit of ABC transporter with duplicated ATPase domains
VLMKELEAESGTFKWGASTKQAYLPKDNTEYFKSSLSVVDWLRQYSTSQDENFVRGFLGRMLFSGEETLKQAKVLSGGEKVRCMLSRMMMMQANVIILDEPTNHLDLESISALNEGMKKYRGTMLFSSHDHQFIQTVANRIIEVTPNGIIDRPSTTFDEYLENKDVQAKRESLYV